MKTMLTLAAVTSLVVASVTLGRAAQSNPLLPQALSASDLAELSGGASPSGIAITTQDLNAVNSGNSVTGNSINTGDITLQQGAFSGFNGVGNFVLNTGNNNNLQGTLSVTILTPAN